MIYKRIIENLFPLEAELTEKILESSNIFDCTECNGALTLKEALKEDLNICTVRWSSIYGSIFIDNDVLHITTKEKINFVMQKEPVKLTFIII